MTTSHTKLKRFQVTRTFVTVVEAERPFAALEMVRADPERHDTEIIERVEMLEPLSDENHLTTSENNNG